MADVLVRHCTFRVVRRGGWSWGPQPRALLEQVLRRLPDLIAEQLDQLVDDNTEVEIAAPVRIAVPLSLRMLHELDEAPTTPALSHSAYGLAARLNTALRAALASERTVESSFSPDRRKELGPSVLPARDAWLGAPADPLSVLLRWARQVDLEERLRWFSVAALRAWHEWIAGARQTAQVNAEEIERTESVLVRLTGRWTEPPCDEAEFLQRRLIALVAAEAAVAGAARNAAVCANVERHFPTPDLPLMSQTSRAVLPERDETIGKRTSQRLAEPIIARQTPKKASSGAMSRTDKNAWLDLRLDSALPFLLLGPLARIGFLDVVAATFESAHGSQDLPLFGVSLAYKVLAPPARGWLRSPSTIASAAAFGLLAEAPTDATLDAMARRIDLSPLGAVVATTLIAGHQPGTPVLLTASGSRFALFDPDGAFPIGIASDIEPLLGNLRCLLHEIVLVPASAASPKVLAALDAAHMRFVTDASPSRGETWRSIRGRPGEMWWSNDTLSAEERLAASGRRLAPGSESAHEFWDTFSVRPSLPRFMHESYEDTLTLAAGLALGSIAWDLWRDREPTAPQLALARFHDLGGWVGVDEASVRVSLPLGRRFRDLHEHGFLNDVSGVPWFGGRLLSFASG